MCVGEGSTRASQCKWMPLTGMGADREREWLWGSRFLINRVRTETLVREPKKGTMTLADWTPKRSNLETDMWEPVTYE